MTRAALLVGTIAMIALSGCATWEHPRGIPPPRTGSLDEQVEARQKADRERAADQVACPACHGQGGFTVDHVQRQAGADGNVRETSVGTSSMTCPYCQNGLVSKARAEEIAQEMR